MNWARSTANGKPQWKNSGERAAETTIVPLLPAELELLRHLLKDEQRSLAGWLLSCLLLSAIWPFVPSRRSADWHFPASADEYLRRLAVAAPLLTGGFLLYYWHKTRRLRRDIAGGQKTVRRTRVLKKEKSTLEGTFSVWLDVGDVEKFKRFNVGSNEYDRIETGRPAELTYAPNSLHLFGINWHI